MIKIKIKQRNYSTQVIQDSNQRNKCKSKNHNLNLITTLTAKEYKCNQTIKKSKDNPFRTRNDTTIWYAQMRRNKIWNTKRDYQQAMCSKISRIQEVSLLRNKVGTMLTSHNRKAIVKSRKMYHPRLKIGQFQNMILPLFYNRLKQTKD